MRKIMLPLLLIGLLHIPVFAQQKFNNEVSFEFSTMRAKGFSTASQFPIFRQIGVVYNRKVYKNFHIGVAYTWWSLYGEKRHFMTATGPVMANIKSVIFDNVSVGDLYSMHSYKIFDLMLSYKFSLNKHSLVGGAVPFFAYGYNSIVDQITVNEDGFTDIQLYLKQEDAQYWGISPLVSYNYSFLKNRLNTGVHIRIRKFFQTDYLQEEMGVRIGVNF